MDCYDTQKLPFAWMPCADCGEILGLSRLPGAFKVHHSRLHVVVISSSLVDVLQSVCTDLWLTHCHINHL